MAGISDSLNAIVDVLANSLLTFKVGFPAGTPDAIATALSALEEFENNYPNMPGDLRDVIIELKTNLRAYSSNIPAYVKDFVSAREAFKQRCIRSLVNGLVAAGWTRFRNFAKLTRLAQ
ncbi:hypothetical protein HY642_06345 [Candidatus Woesearchaeota archaeon]|nr:hypothetical protein [Candidatus Woesearchaeota archaeon]